MQDETKVCSEVDAVLEKTGTRRMIMGHTPDFRVRRLSIESALTVSDLLLRKNIVSRCNGKIIIIDTGKYWMRLIFIQLSNMSSFLCP